MNNVFSGKVIERAVIYARVSYDDRGNKAINLQSQVRDCKEYASSKGYQIIDILTEDEKGASGADEDLTGFKQLVRMAQNDEYDVLVTRSIKRFGRDVIRILTAFRDLQNAGVSIDFIKEGREQHGLVKLIKAWEAESEKADIIRRTKVGRENVVKNGSVMVANHPPFGYRKVGTSHNWQLEIIPDEARIVRLIFEWYAGPERLSLYKIAKRLTKMGILTPADKGKAITQKGLEKGVWCPQTIRGFLTNTTYIGEWRYGKTRKIKKKLVRNKTGEGVLVVKTPAIIDKESFQLAQVRLEDNKKLPRRKKYDYLMSGRITCGGCNKAAVGISKGGYKGKIYQYYRCNTQQTNRPGQCNQGLFKAKYVDEKVWNWLKKIIGDPDYLKAKLFDYQDQQDKQNTPIHQELKTVTDSLCAWRSKRQRWLEMYADKLIEKDELIANITPMDALIKRGEQRQQELETHLQTDITDETIEEILNFASIIREELIYIEVDFKKKRWLVEAMNVQCKLLKQGKDIVIEASCHIAKETLGHSDNNHL